MNKKMNRQKHVRQKDEEYETNATTATAMGGATTMPVLVSSASWSAIRLDDRHIRLVLVDPGYSMTVFRATAPCWLVQQEAKFDGY